MARGTKLQEMEKSVAESNAVTANAAPAEKVGTLNNPPQGLTPIEDLGGPTPENYKPDNDSAKLKTPGGTLKQVKNVVNKGAGKGEPMKGITATAALKSGDEVELEADQEVVAEAPATEEVVEEIVDDTPEVNIEDDVNALLGGEELSEEFKAKAKTIFETAVKTRVAEAKAEIEASPAEKLEEEVNASKAELQERVDNYLEYVSDEWFTENQLAVEQGLKTDLTESFLEGMKNLFEEHYVSIPEEKYDVLESMVEKLDDMESKLNEQMTKNINLNKRLGESVASGILESVSDGLAATQKEKLASLSESVEFESEESYREKLETLKESYFSKAAPAAKTSGQQTLSEGVDSTPEPVTGSMDRYLKTLGAFSNQQSELLINSNKNTIR